MGLIQARAKLINGDGRVYVGDSNVLSVNNNVSVLPKDLSSDKLLVMLGALNMTKFYFVAGDKLVIEKITSTTPEVITRTGVINITKTGWQTLSSIAPTGFKETESGGSNLFFNRYYIEPVEYAGDRYYSTAYTLERISSINFCKRLIFAASELAPAGIRDIYANMSLWGETNPNTGVSALVIPAHLEDLSGLFDNAGSIMPFSAEAALPKIITLGKIKKMQRTFHNAFAYGMFTYSTPIGAVVFGEMDVSEVTDFSYCFGQSIQANPDVENWNVSSATNMTGMFAITADWTTRKWTRDLSGWCVSNITSEPTNFALNQVMTAAQKPVWGTCPVVPIISADVTMYYNEQSMQGDNFRIYTAGFVQNGPMKINNVVYNDIATVIGLLDTLAVPPASPVFSLFSKYNKVSAKATLTNGTIVNVGWTYRTTSTYTGQRIYEYNGKPNIGNFHNLIKPHHGKPAKLTLKLYN